MFDILIAGAGPAGLTAAIYAARGGLKVAAIEGSFAGGQMAISSTIENYPGYENDIPGATLANSMRVQAQRLGAEIINDTIKSFDIAGTPKKISTSKNIYEAHSVILAMGAVPRQIGVDGEMKLAGSGVSYCATCDGNFFKEREVAVVGGGNTAVEDALYLANICSKVYLVHRRMEFRAQHALVKMAGNIENIEFVTPYIPKKITGEFSVDGILVENVQTKDEKKIDVAGVFMAVGQIPKTDLVKGVVDLDENGYIKADESCRTGVPGVFCAGDIRTKHLRQIVTATSDGAAAATAAEEYLFAYCDIGGK